MLELKGNLDDHFPLIEFAQNNNYHSSIEVTSYDALYGLRCRYPTGWIMVGKSELIVQDIINQSIKEVKIIQQILKTEQRCQKSYKDVRLRY